MTEHIDTENILGRVKAIQTTKYSWPHPEVPFSPWKKGDKLYTFSPLAGCGCACGYCWARSMFARQSAKKLDTDALKGRLWEEPTYLPFMVKLYRREIWKLSGKRILLSNMCDPMGSPTARKVFPEILTLALRARALPVILAKRIPTRGASEFFELNPELERALINTFTGLWWGASITTADAHVAAEIEPGAASPQERVAFLRSLKEWGATHTPGKIRTFVSVGGVHTETDLERLIGEVSGAVDLVIVELLHKRNVGTGFPWAEYLVPEAEWRSVALQAIRAGLTHGVKVALKDELREIMQADEELSTLYAELWER